MTFTDKLQKFLDTTTKDNMPPSVTALRAMLAVAFVTGACAYANDPAPDAELEKLAREMEDQFESWRGH